MYMLGAVAGDIAREIAQIKQEAAGRGIRVMRGRLIGPGGAEAPRVVWVADGDGDWREFLDFAQSVGVKAVVIDFDRIDMELLRADVEDAAVDEEYEEGRTKMLQMLEKLDKHDGEIGHVGIIFPHGPLVYQASVRTPWYDDYVTVREIAGAADEFAEEEEDPFDIQ
ncbi:MAG TPA: hypothetical protein PK112_07425 [candidate division Zixibacteria bacterium]|nr:hypothetical protein [candidate division Zixibacteria bacterium]